jgi:hypothetical protein
MHTIELFWPIITALIVPPFLWQGAVAVTKSGPLRLHVSLLVWTVTLVLVAGSLWIFSGLALSNALLLGTLTVTLVWFFRELNVERSYLSTIGLITLVMLLIEIDLAVISLQYWLGTLASGTAIGFAIGFLGIATFRKYRKLQSKNIFFFAWTYVAYLAGLIFDTSPIATTLAAALIVSTYGYSIGLWYSQKDIPTPSDHPFFFYLSAGLWLILGWQAHSDLAPAALLGILPALAVIAISILIIRLLIPLSTENRMPRLLRKEGSALLLLLGSMIYWPKEALITTLSVEIALLASIILIVIIRVSLPPLFDLMGIQLSWPTKE